MNKQKFSLYILSGISVSLIISSCAGPESYQQKMERYEPKASSNNQVPLINLTNFNFKSQEKSSVKGGRSPASYQEKNTLELDGKESNPSNKKLYFLTLLSEYEDLQNFSPEYVGPAISICPSFHTSLLRHNNKITNNPKKAPSTKFFTYDVSKYNDEMYLTSSPELLLPISKEEIMPKVVDVIKNSKGQMSESAINELVHKAIDIHLSKTYAEIREICEYGFSDNYYIYENLITHIKNNKFEASNQYMNTLLKTTVFSNIALMTSLEKQKARSQERSIASENTMNKNAPYAAEVISRLDVSWANQYFEYIKKSH